MFDVYNEDEVFGNAVDLQAAYQDNLDQQIQLKLGKKPGSLVTALPLGNLFDQIDKEGFGLRSGHLEPLYINAPRAGEGSNSDDEFEYVVEEVEVNEDNANQEPEKPDFKSEAPATADAPSK